jgi:hypothetical protein
MVGSGSDGGWRIGWRVVDSGLVDWMVDIGLDGRASVCPRVAGSMGHATEDHIKSKNPGKRRYAVSSVVCRKGDRQRALPAEDRSMIEEYERSTVYMRASRGPGQGG